MIDVQKNYKKQLHALRIVTWFLAISLVSLILVFAALYLPIDILAVDDPVFVVSDTVIEIDNETYPVIYKGDEFIIQFHYEKKQDYTEVTKRTIVCEKGFLGVFSDVHKNLPRGSHDVTFGNLVIPNRMTQGDVPDDICHVEYLVVYKINGIREDEKVPTKSEKFFLTERSINEFSN